MLDITADGIVPMEQPKLMAAQLTKVGAKYEMLTIENGGHNLDEGRDFKADTAFSASLGFLRMHLPEPRIVARPANARSLRTSE